MKETELRLGNLVQDYNNRPVTVTKDIIYFFRKIGCDQNTALIPILLTEEWLIDNKLNEGIGVHNDNFSGFITVKYSKYLSCYEVFIGTTSIRTLKHVHTLQNWWHSNTGEELELKEATNEKV